jgi:hypothetical protein
MKKKVSLIIALIVVIQSAICQVVIETTPILKQRTSFEFSEEWQYLSTDIFLINPEKFNILVNDLDAETVKLSGGKKKKGNSEYIEYLLVTAKVKDLKFFGGDLVYPIYNFQFSKGTNESYNSNISKSFEVLRIIDNLPLSSHKDFVEADIQAEAVTNTKQDRLNSIVSESLKSIAKIANPSEAVFSLIGEYGKIMESRIQRTQYQFSSTIRLYEEQDFSKQLHSINVYQFELSSYKPTKMNTQELEKYILSDQNPLITKDVLAQKINYTKYPYLVIANYKSKYISEPAIGDEIDSETIKIRTQKVKNAYDKGIINKETYTQEMELIEFLKTFVDLKLSINNYKLNYKNEITKDFSKSFFIILQNFRNLKNIKLLRDKSYADNKLYNSEFRKSYESIITNAELYLDENNSLKSIKELVNTLFEYENLKKESTIDEKERYLQKLYAVELPETESSSTEVLAINRLTSRLESEILTNQYNPLIQNLNIAPATSEGLQKAENLKTKMNSSYCKTCKEQGEKALIAFDERYQKILVKEASSQTDLLKKEAKDLVFKLLIKEDCIDKNLAAQYPQGTAKPAYIELFVEEYNLLKKQREEMFELTKSTQDFKNMQELNKFNDKLDIQIQKLEQDFNDLCSKVTTLCTCE